MAEPKAECSKPAEQDEPEEFQPMYIKTIKTSSDKSEEIEFYYTKSKYGNKMLVVNGHRFKYHQDLGKKGKRWLCINTRSRCHASAFTIDDVLDRVRDTHNHPLIIGKAAKTRKVAIAEGSGDTEKLYFVPIVE